MEPQKMHQDSPSAIDRQSDAINDDCGKSVGIVGAGLMGRILALRLADQGWQITLFDRDTPDGTRSCGYVGAGMLSPISELETADPLIARLGIESLPLWRQIVDRLEGSVFRQEAGTLVVAHAFDTPDLQRFSQQLQNRLNACQKPRGAHDGPLSINGEGIQWRLSPDALRALEPELSDRFSSGIFIPGEGQIDNRQLLNALRQMLECHPNVRWRSETPVGKIAPNRIHVNDEIHCFDWVADCRGLGANLDIPTLRGVRGELLRVHAPDVHIHRPIRLMHPRHPLYVVPRENHHFLIGATSIESEVFRPMTLQSAMELMSAAFTVHPGFAEATLEEMSVQCRPALPDNLPKIRYQPGFIGINGLYRHGFLISPRLAEIAAQAMESGLSDVSDPILFENSEKISERIAEEPAYAVTR
jgi:glycine oxidase